MKELQEKEKNTVKNQMTKNSRFRIGVVGAGQMGGGITQICAQAGLATFVFDPNSSQLKRCQESIKNTLEKGKQKGKWTQEHSDETLKALTFCSTMDEFVSQLTKNNITPSNPSDSSNFDELFLIEAATEQKSLKFKIFLELDQLLPKEAILASNTSSISITEIAAQTKRPDKVVGMHFMNPVPIMKLVEGIKGLETSEKTFQKTQELAVFLGKVFVTARDMPGFAVNRILMPMINEAFFALYEGIATASDIDQAMVLGTNVPMGPLTLADFIGLDTCLSILEVLYEGFKDPKFRPCPLLKQYVLSGRLGRKIKKGVFEYE